MSPDPWWRDAVVYQIYPRSFQDSDGDGIGDLAGITSRLDHLSWLGVDALWLSPIYPSPLADMGYDVSDHTGVAPELGTLADFDDLVANAHSRGIRVLLDLIPSHTSIEHPWFREHPEYYVWADEPPNNWVAAFGGPAWSLDPRRGRYYLHSFYPEQPDLDWHVPEVRDAIGDVVRFWGARGVDGFRVDAVQQLMKDRDLRDDPLATAGFPLPLGEEYSRLEHLHSESGPEVGLALAALRQAAGERFLVGEVYRPTAALAPFVEHLDLAFAFELLHSALEPAALAAAIEPASRLGRVAWALSNHDFPRVATRFGEPAAALAALLLLTLPGPAFIYQGEEIGMVDGPGADPPYDRAGRDPHRHPMQWEPGPRGGFTRGEPWLGLTDPGRRNVAAQRTRKGSLLRLYRELIALRRKLHGPLSVLESDTALVFRRGDHLIALNPSPREVPAPAGGDPLFSTTGARRPRGPLRPYEGAIFERSANVRV